LFEGSLRFYGITKDPETKEFIIIIQLAKENLRNFLLSNSNSILWKDKINYLCTLAFDLGYLHGLGYFHKNFHSENILQIGNSFYISDFNNKVCGVLQYIAPEVLRGKPYTLFSNIYSFGIIMTELSSGRLAFYNKKHDSNLVTKICSGLRLEFGKETPEIYKKLACKCMSNDPNQRPTASELCLILYFWYCSIKNNLNYYKKENFGYKGEKIKAIFEKADRIQNILPTNSSISHLYEENNEGNFLLKFLLLIN